jgi:PAS domain S-box-containing protein
MRINKFILGMWRKIKLQTALNTFMRPLVGSTARARVLRIFLPLITSILLLQGILNVLLDNYYHINPSLLSEWLTVFSIILSVFVILYVTRIIFQFTDKAEKERILVEEALAASEKKYRYLFENNPQPMWICDLETFEFLEVNDYAILHYGYSRTEFLNMTLNDLRPIDDENALIDEIGKNTDGFYLVGDWRYQKKNGEIIYVEINSHLIDYEGKLACLVLAADITKRKIIENTLKESEAQFRDLFDEAPLGYHELDLEGKIIRVNQTEFEMLGYTRDEMLGKYAWEFIVDQEASKNAVHSKITCNKSIEKNFERIMRRKDGTSFPVLMEDLLLFDKNGKCTGIRTAVQNITERKKAEIEIVRINKELTELNATKDKFFSIIGHDLRGPIGGFKSLIEMMISNFDLTDTAMLTRTLKIIQSSASSTYELLENLLAWARTQRNEIEFNPEYINLNEITALSMKPLKGSALGKQINIIDNLPSNKIVYADSNMLMTILRNLISNSIKFTYPGKNVYLSAFKNHNGWTLSVRDEGIGIKPENIYKIFDSSENFTTSGTLREKGSGLGLLLCKEFVKKHGGEIWVVNDKNENQDSKGSEFQFTLPNPQLSM